MDYAKLAEDIVKEHTTYGTGEKAHQSYEPIYWAQGYNDTDEEVLTEYLSGSDKWRETAYEKLDEWASQNTWMDAQELVRQYVAANDDLPEDFNDSQLEDAVNYELQEACTQDYAREWVTGMESPVVRVMLTDEDHPGSWVENDEDWTPERLATNAGIEHSEKNLKACQVILDNAYYPGTVKMLFLVFRVDLDDVLDDGNDMVRINGEVELWATNPFMGDGMADTVDVDMVVERSQLKTDKQAAGYSYDDVFGPVRSMIPMPSLEFTKKVEV